MQEVFPFAAPLFRVSMKYSVCEILGVCVAALTVPRALKPTLPLQNAKVFTQFQPYRIFPLIDRVLTSCNKIMLFVASDSGDHWKLFYSNIY